MDSGSLVSRFSHRTTAKFCWRGAIMALVSIKLVPVYDDCTTWFSCIYSLKFLAQAFKRGGEGKVQIPFPSPFELLLRRLFLVLIMTFLRVARGVFNPVIPTQISAESDIKIPKAFIVYLVPCSKPKNASLTKLPNIGYPFIIIAILNLGPSPPPRPTSEI